MTKTELLENYTAEQLAEMVLELTWKMWTNSEECKSIPPKVSIIVKCPDCGKPNKIELDEKSECLIRNKLTDRVHELQSEVEKYRKAFESAKKERDQQVCEYQKKVDELYNSLRTLDGNLKVSNAIIENTIKNENGMETNTIKFDNIKQFAEYIKCFYTVNLDYIQKVFWGNEQKQNIDHNITDFLPTEPIKVADMLINAEGEYEHNPIAKKICGTNKGAYRIFDILELRQIAEHLLVYCNHNGEAEG